MVVKASLFKVDNGDMVLFETESGRRILVDINIREAADDEGDDEPFEEKLPKLTALLKAQMEESHQLDRSLDRILEEVRNGQ